MDNLAERVLEAYGGERLWKEAKRVRVVFSAWGWAFRLKWRPPTVIAVAEIDPWKVEVSLFQNDGKVGRLSAGSVRIENNSGELLSERKEPWRFFPYGRRALYWDDLDQLWFSGYALWNYFTFPHLLLREDISWTQVGPDKLSASFGKGLPSHCREQAYRVDENTGRLIQHDYTAEVFGGWAKAAHMVCGHSVNAQGLAYTSKRRVYPRKSDGTPRPWPLLVGIDVHEYEVTG